MNRKRLFLITAFGEGKNLFPCISVNKSTPVIREVTNLFLEIRQHRL